MPTKHLLIKGKVQGVFYRASAKEVAERLGITGWVKNTEEGAVEALVTGTVPALEDFVRWCRRGPAGANVSSVGVVDSEQHHFDGFRILRR